MIPYISSTMTKLQCHLVLVKQDFGPSKINIKHQITLKEHCDNDLINEKNMAIAGGFFVK